jgi:hypothetical protein
MAGRFVADFTAHNRPVYAPGLTALRGSVSLGRYAPTLNSTHIFASSGNLRFPLSGLQKRHIQPERYAQCTLKFIGNYFDKNIDKTIEIYYVVLELYSKNIMEIIIFEK